MRICTATGTEGLIADLMLFSSALRRLGHQVDVFTPHELAKRLKRYPKYELFIIVTRGNDVDFYARVFAGRPFIRLAVWYLSTKTDSGNHFPTSFNQAEYIASKGGWVFFAQYLDFLESFESTSRVSWLPVGTDTDVYSPHEEERSIVYDICLLGDHKNYPTEMKKITSRSDNLRITEFDPSVPSDIHRKLCVSKFALNFPGFIYNKYDMTPLVYGVLSAGVPILTNASDSLPRLFDRPIYLRTYRYENMDEEVRAALGDDVFLTSGRLGRASNIRKCSYEFRALQMLSSLRDQRIIRDEENGQIFDQSKN